MMNLFVSIVIWYMIFDLVNDRKKRVKALEGLLEEAKKMNVRADSSLIDDNHD